MHQRDSLFIIFFSLFIYGCAQAEMLRGMWTHSGSGIAPLSPALAGRFFTTEPPGKPHVIFYLSGKVLSCSMQDLLSVAACAIFSCGRWALKFPDPSWAPQIRSMESLSLDQPASPQGRGLMGGKVPGLGARKRVCKVAPGASCKAAAQPQDIGAASLLQKRCPSHYRGLECKSRMSRNTWSNRQIWPWSTE